MMRTSSLLLLVFLAGCATRTWTETTDVTRTTGPTREVIEQRPLAGAYFELRTDLEADGYTHTDNFTANSDGRIDIDLLAPAIQCLHYGHDLTLELWSFDEQAVAYTRKLDAETSREAIKQWTIQARLGAKVRLRKAEADVLDRLIEGSEDVELREQLDVIRSKLTIRPSWE